MPSIYAYVFENIKSVRLEALLLSLVSIIVLVVVKELNEQFKRKLKLSSPSTNFVSTSEPLPWLNALQVVSDAPRRLRTSACFSFHRIPPPRTLPMGVLSGIVTEAFKVALVGYVASLALAQVSAKKFKYSVDDNQELLAHGLSNMISSFCFCISRAPAVGNGWYSTGSTTQVTHVPLACLISCIFVLIVIYAIGPLLHWLPMCVLASINVLGLKGMLIQFWDLKKYWNVDKIDGGIWILTYVFTNIGLLFGVVSTISIVIGRFPREKTLNIINMKEMDFKVKTETDDETLQQVKIISISNPLVFLNVKKFGADVMNLIQKESQLLNDINKCEQKMLLHSLTNGHCNDDAAQPCSSEKCSLVLDCSGLTFFDYSGVSMIVEVYMDCKGRNVDVSLASCTDKRVSSVDLACDPPMLLLISVLLALSCSHLDQSSDVLGNLDSEK
ncbi:LOW QUALITY PROTEIN: anion exchange transporter-like [Thomomys bottae]